MATLLTLAAGSRVEDARALKVSPSALRSPPKAAPERSRVMGALSPGLAALSRLPAKGGMRRRVRLLPEPWPPPPDGLKAVLRPETSNLPPQAFYGRRLGWARAARKRGYARSSLLSLLA